MDIPAFLLVHSVTVETYEGTGIHGPVYGAPQTVACFREGESKLVRDSNGDQVVSSTTLYCAPGQAAVFLPLSRVSWPGRETTVISAANRDDAGMGAPQHTEVTLA